MQTIDFENMFGTYLDKAIRTSFSEDAVNTGRIFLNVVKDTTSSYAWFVAHNIDRDMPLCEQLCDALMPLIIKIVEQIEKDNWEIDDEDEIPSNPTRTVL